VSNGLQGINWDFSDYNSSKYPLDINSIPWYPATFIPPIPKLLIALLTQPGDTVFDPFGGKGTTAVESIKLGRLPIYNDLNPFAVEIAQAIISAIKKRIHNWDLFNNEAQLIEEIKVDPNAIENLICELNINEDALKWYERSTLNELLGIVKLMYEKKSESEDTFLIRKLAFSSILKPASSQPGHFTYITDNCKPKTLIYKNAKKLYINRVKQIMNATDDLINQFNINNSNNDLKKIINKALVHAGVWISRSGAM
jgi:DNA modification methylase